MRDPKRIPEVLVRLGELWERSPDLRLGQLMMMLADPKDEVCPTLFYLEDNELLKRVNRCLSAEWSLYRQDDNGQPFLVASGMTHEEAKRRAREMEALGHRQVYWVEMDRPD